MKTLENRSEQDNTLVDFAGKIFKSALKSKMIYQEKEIKFYHVDGVKMASLALNFECEDATGVVKKCMGCSKCMEDRLTFGEEYNRLTSEYKDNAISHFTEIANKESKKSQETEKDF